MDLTRLAVDAGQFINRAVQVNEERQRPACPPALFKINSSLPLLSRIRLFCHIAPVHRREPRPGGKDRAGLRAGGTPGSGGRHQDLDGLDHFSNRGATAT